MIKCDEGNLIVRGEAVMLMAETTLILAEVSAQIADALEISQEDVIKQIRKTIKKANHDDN